MIIGRKDQFYIFFVFLFIWVGGGPEFRRFTIKLKSTIDVFQFDYDNADCS